MKIKTKPIVVYDGRCPFCQRNLRWLNALDWFHRFQSRPYQDEQLYEEFPFLQREACEQAIHLIFANGKFYQGASAVRAILLRLPATWWVGLLMYLPPVAWLARRGYTFMARHRAKISKKLYD